MQFEANYNKVDMQKIITTMSNAVFQFYMCKRNLGVAEQ